MNNLQLRAISGAAYVGVILLAIFLGYEFVSLLMLVFGLMGMYELQKMLQPHATTSVGKAALVIDYVALGFALMSTFDLVALLSFFILMLVRIGLTVFDTSTSAVRALAVSAFSIIYLAMGLVSVDIFALITQKGSKALLLALFVMIWMNDTGAYLVGSRYGRNRLCERLSPKKSWEGFWGGMACCVITGIVFWASNRNGYGTPDVGVWITLGLVVSAVATVGDLLESQLKRFAGVKDSGNLIPGHGGILDRIDSLLLVAPASLLLIALMVFQQLSSIF